MAPRLLSAAEERELAHRMRAAHDAGETEVRLALREQLVTRNLGLAWHVARKIGRVGCLEVEDLAQEGVIGLTRAVELFDPDRGCRLSTYAMHWVRQAISRAVLRQARLVRLPARAAEELSRHRRGMVQLTDERAWELEAAAREPASLDAPAHEDAPPLGDLLRDPEPADPGAALERAERERALERLLAALSPRERLVVVHHRHGVGGAAELSAARLGGRLGVARETVRQMEKRAVKRLRGACASTAPEARLGARAPD